nr:PAS domain S-box protein [Melioribacteraceae bacterium]
SIIFSNNHDTVMAAIKKDEIDVGVVRTGILEEYQRAGKINVKDYKVINQDLDYQAKHKFNLLLSTKLYPEWLICKLEHTDETITKQILEALLHIKETDNAAIKGDYSEFLSSADYMSVSKVLMALDMFPYPSYKEPMVSEKEKQFTNLQLILFVLLPVFIIVIVLFVYYQRKFFKQKEKSSEQLLIKDTIIEKLRKNEAQTHLLIENMPYGVLIVDKNYKISLINKKLIELLKLKLNKDYVGLDFNIFLNNWFEIANINKQLRDKIIRITHILQDRSISSYFGEKYILISHYSLPEGGFIRTFKDISEEKKERDRLIQIEKNYQLITEGWTDLIWNIDLELNIFYISANIEQITGYTVEEYLSKKLYEILTPKSFEIIKELAQNAVANPELVIGKRIEFEHINKNGSTQWYETTLMYHDDKENNRSYFAGVSRDISQKKKIEEELKQSEERFRLVYDQSPVGVVILDLDLTIKTANKSIFNLFGYESDEIIGKSYLGLFAPEETHFKKDVILDFIKGNNSEILPEFKFLTKSKKIIWGKVSGSAIMNLQGEVICFTQVIEDITALKKAESFLKETDLQFRQVWENSFDGMRLTDKDGVMVLVNKSFCNLVKKTAADLIGKPFSVIYQENIADEILKKGKEKFHNHLIETNFERELTLWNNEKVWFELSNSHIFIDNEPKLLLSIFHDITKRKQAEDEITKYSKRLEEVNAGKDKFFSIIAHELKSPFQSSLGISDILVNEFDSLDTQETKELITSLNRSLNNQFNLLKNLLDWSRLQSGRMECNPDNIIIKEVIEDVIYLLQNNIKNKLIKIEVNVEKSHIIIADYWMFRTVITNLIANAIKFTYNNGSIKIYSKVLEEEIEISVEDNGMGIDLDDMMKLFKIDCQITTIGTNNEKGTGLGLILCKEMIEKNNGKIGVESKLNLGSRFYFSLPKAKF